MAQFTRLELDLNSEFSRGSQHNAAGSGASARNRSGFRCLGAVVEGGDDGQEKGTGFARACLGTAHEVVSGECERYGVFLDGGGFHVVHE